MAFGVTWGFLLKTEDEKGAFEVPGSLGRIFVKPCGLQYVCSLRWGIFALLVFDQCPKLLALVEFILNPVVEQPLGVGNVYHTQVIEAIGQIVIQIPIVLARIGIGILVLTWTFTRGDDLHDFVE